MHWKDWTFIFSNYVKVSVSAIVIVIVKVSVILEAWKMKFGRDATVIRLVGGIQAMEMQVMMSQLVIDCNSPTLWPHLCLRNHL